MVRDPRESKGQVEKLARAYHRKFYGFIGASLEVEDLEQEFWIVWTRVNERFDPTRGFAFEALLGVSIRNRAIHIARHYGLRQGIKTSSLDAMAKGSDKSFVETIPSYEPSAESEIIRRERTSHLMENMDSRLRGMVELLTDEPEELQREVVAAQAKAEFGATLGVNTVAPKDLSLGMLTELYGLSRCSRYRLLDNMKEIEGDHE